MAVPPLYLFLKKKSEAIESDREAVLSASVRPLLCGR